MKNLIYRGKFHHELLTLKTTCRRVSTEGTPYSKRLIGHLRSLYNVPSFPYPSAKNYLRCTYTNDPLKQCRRTLSSAQETDEHLEPQTSSLLDLLNDNHDFDNDTTANRKDFPKKPKTKRKRTTTKATKKPKHSANLIPKQTQPLQQTKKNAQTLFDYIAPHISHAALLELKDKIQEFEQQMEKEMDMYNQMNVKKRGRKKKKKEESLKRIMDHQTIIGAIDTYFSKQGDTKTTKRKKPTKKDKEKVDATLNEFPWIKSLLAQFFAGPVDTQRKEDNNISDDIEIEREMEKLNLSKSESMIQFDAILGMTQLWRDDSFSPNINRQNFEHDVSTLMLAREMCLESPFFWSNNQRRRQKFKRYAWVEETRDNPTDHTMFQKDLHYEKSSDTLRKEAESMISLLAFRLPPEEYRQTISLFETYGKAVSRSIKNNEDVSLQPYCDVDSIQDDKPEVMKMLFPNLKGRVGFHVHLVATELAEFFYVEIPNNSDEDELPLKSRTTGDIEIMKQQRLGKSDSRINEAWDEWNDLRDNMVRLSLSAQHMYCRLNSAMKRAELGKISSTQNEDKEKKEEDDEEGTESHDESSNIAPNEKEVEQIMIKYSRENHERTEELMAKLDELRTNEDGELVGHSVNENTRIGKPPKRASLRFDCYLLSKRFGPYGSLDTALDADIDGREESIRESLDSDIAMLLPSTKRTIFVDNLPIDITKEELEYLYSRCGPIKKLEIFNLRPDLDPGALSMKKVLHQRRKNRKTGGSKDAGETHINRSPVYALIEFEGDDGYRTATIQMLRIFGMVIRRQAAKSHPARSTNKIFIENIPQGLYSMDIEIKLSEVLHPDIYVSLSLGQHINSEPSNCILSFPTFEIAYYAYQKLQNVNFGSDECVMHWMKTPPNAMGYWTREIIPEN